MDKLLIVTDGKAGHENQSKAFCHGLGFGFETWKVAYASGFRKALAYGADRLGLLTEAPFEAGPPPEGDFKAVVCTGSTAFYPGKVIARRRGIPVAAILYPQGFRLDFDCILAPAFDNPVERPNIIPVPVNLTAPDEAFYAAGVAAFRERHKQAAPAVAVVIGGPNGFAGMDAARMRRDLDSVFELTKGKEKWVTTSRRTPPEIDRLLDTYPFDYKLIYSRDHFNPIPAFVSLCERLFVTADSTGMISEAVTQGPAKVEVLMNLKGSGSKFSRFICNLALQDAAHVFNGTLGEASKKIDLAPVYAKARELLFGR
jgi:mitochondrial fission protein ELM1